MLDFRNNYSEFTRFYCSITVRFTWNIASNTASKIVQKDRDTLLNRAVTAIMCRSCFDCFIRVSRSSCINFCGYACRRLSTRLFSSCNGGSLLLQWAVAKKLDPLIFIPPVQNYRNIWTPGTKMFEIIGPPLKYFILLQNLFKHYFHACIKGVQIFRNNRSPLDQLSPPYLLYIVCAFDACKGGSDIRTYVSP